MPTVTAWQCLYRPEDDPPAPIGQYHCPLCGCVVISRVEHGACFPLFCPAADEGWHPGVQVEVEVTDEELAWLELSEP